MRCLKKFQDRDWQDILTVDNVDIANSLLEERILDIINSEAPMRTVQLRTKYNQWITDSTKLTMAARDKALDKARITGEHLDWTSFRKLRNSCT